MEILVENIEKNYTIEEYLAMEEVAVEKHEFYNGKIIKMAGAKPNHNIIAANIIAELIFGTQNKSKEYFVLTGDSKIYNSRLNSFLYPDAVVICEAIELYPGSSTVITNPLLIVEVLSPSTEEHDRTGKFYDYKLIPSFKEYVLVWQTIPSVTTSYKIGERTWQDTEADGIDTTIYLQSIDCSIDLRKIYRGIKF
ncbi:MAG: Uma2 family endonuclease [Ferruginibacter sp.]|nr:Uma2 family endonuclease [Ferruginibacter sp.]